MQANSPSATARAPANQLWRPTSWHLQRRDVMRTRILNPFFGGQVKGNLVNVEAHGGSFVRIRYYVPRCCVCFPRPFSTFSRRRAHYAYLEEAEQMLSRFFFLPLPAHPNHQLTKIESKSQNISKKEKLIHMYTVKNIKRTKTP